MLHFLHNFIYVNLLFSRDVNLSFRISKFLGTEELFVNFLVKLVFSALWGKKDKSELHKKAPKIFGGFKDEGK